MKRYLHPVLFTIAKTWKQPKCPLTDEWIKHGIDTCGMSFSHKKKKKKKKKEILPFATTGMDLRVFLSEISQTEKDKYCIISLVCRI